jgi:hypothetical protein
VSGFDLRHALAVAGRVDGADAKLAAILHDAVEDGACSLDDLRAAEIPEAVVVAVSVLTRGPLDSYGAYIARIGGSGNELARVVKLADLAANLARLDPEHASLERRYRDAVRTLTYGSEVPL